jgi:hypothetical protein
MGNEELYMSMSNAANEKSRQYTIQRCVDETEIWYNSVLDNKKKILRQRQLHFAELLKKYYKLAISITKV